MNILLLKMIQKFINHENYTCTSLNAIILTREFYNTNLGRCKIGQEDTATFTIKNKRFFSDVKLYPWFLFFALISMFPYCYV